MTDHIQQRVEFGDFQTPINLAREICRFVAQTGFYPAAVLEPTCGTGSFIKASLEIFPKVQQVTGFEINPRYVAQAKQDVICAFPRTSVEVHQSNFFLTDWPAVIQSLPEPILIIGNPPWVTNAKLGALNSANAPEKLNIDNLNGIDAVTGKSNFDISEFIIRKCMEWLDNKNGLLAMICKTSVARKVLLYAWRSDLRIGPAALYLLDARAYFGASVDAGLLIVQSSPASSRKQCKVFRSLCAPHPDSTFCFQSGTLIADINLYYKWNNLMSTGFQGWRSGIKHDCSKVFELRVGSEGLVNGLGEDVDVEPDMLFPLLKSSDLAAHRQPHRWIIIPQRTISDDPSRLRLDAPKTWRYLAMHAPILNRRKSTVYKNRPPFSVFGVGAYTFAPWKIAISGLYKQLDFVLVSPVHGRPVVLDDTCYFLPCRSKEACAFLYELVTSDPAREFWSALIFWDAKRPITAQLLNALDLAALARVLGKESERVRLLADAIVG